MQMDNIAEVVDVVFASSRLFFLGSDQVTDILPWQNSLGLLNPITTAGRQIAKMRFWSAFHRYLLEIILNSSEQFIFRAPNHIRLRMTVNHLELNQTPGSCLTHYNHQTCLWECYHSPETIGHHRLFLWVCNDKSNEQWTTAVRFDVYVEEKRKALYYPLTTDLFNQLRCQLIEPMNGKFSRASLPTEIDIRVPGIRGIQLQIDEHTVVDGELLPNDIYTLKIPLSIGDHVKNFVLMGLCSTDSFYSILITYRIE